MNREMPPPWETPTFGPSPGVTGHSPALTLVDLQEGVCQLAGEDGLRQVAEILLQQVSHVVRRLPVVVDVVGAGFVHVPERLNPGLHPRLSENANLPRKSRLVLEHRAGTKPAGIRADSHGAGKEAPAPQTSLPCNPEQNSE